METTRSDFLVIGSGIAGLYYALSVAEHGTVAIVTKKERADSNTNYAQGGIASVVSPDDSYELHIEDTLRTGAGICNRAAVEVTVREGPAHVKKLLDLGVEFTMRDGQFDLGREGGHSRNRIVHAKDLTGREIERVLLARASEHPNIQLFEHHAVIELITNHHLISSKVESKDKSPCCYGAYVLDERSGKISAFLAFSTLLATGGVGQVYLHTTNPTIATGDGIAIAYRAGARIANMEFIQFHPTALYNSGSPAFLISEAVRGFGAVLRTRDGEEFMSRYDERGSLASRDIVARAIDTELKKRGDDFVYLDLRHLSADAVREQFPYIYTTCKERFKLDITKEPVPVVPAAHYSCGGIATDLHGRTTIGDLYAAGEVSMTGLHGANRLASNSLLEALVFSARAARASCGALSDLRARGKNVEKVDVAAWENRELTNYDEWVLISHNRKEIQQLMWDYVGIVRSMDRLKRALRRIQLIQAEVEDFYRRTRISTSLLELRNLACVAGIIVKSALRRQESRGLHYMIDFPYVDDEHFRHDTVLEKERDDSLWEEVSI